MKIVRLVLLAACLVAPVACNGGGINEPAAPVLNTVPVLITQNSMPMSTETADSTSRDGSHTFGSGH